MSTYTEHGKPEPAQPVGPFDRRSAGIAEGQDEKPKGRLVGFAAKHNWRWLGRVLQIQGRYGELQGSNIASAVTLQIFLSLFPLMLVAAAAIGFVVHGHSDVTGRIINGMGLHGHAATSMQQALQTAEKSRKAGSIIGLATLAWSALGVSAALQYAYNQAWQSHNRGLKDKAVGAGWLAGAATLFVASAAATTVLNWLPAGLSMLGIVVSVVISFALWSFTAKVLPNVNVAWRSVVPGAIVGTIGLETLKILGAVWVPKAVASSSGLYGSVGIVLAVLAFLLLFGKLVVYSAVTNVIFDEARNGTTQAVIDMPTAAASHGDGATRSGRSTSK